MKGLIVLNRILIFGMTENPGGVENVIMNYYRKLNRKKYQFDFLCNTNKVAYSDEINSLGGKIYKIVARSNNRKEYKKQINEFFKNHSKEYNTIWVNVCSLANIDYLKYAKKYGIKYRIIHSHNSQNMDSKLRGILHKINKIFIKKYATDFWACSDDAGEWFYDKSIINSNRYLVVNNAIDIDKFKYNEDIRNKYRKELNIENKIVIGNVGRLHFQKNQSFAIDIYNKLQKNNNNVIMLIIGQGEDYDKLKSKVDSLNLQDKVIFLGVRNDIPELMQAMDIFLFPSVFEGLGLVLIESQASGLLTYASSNVIPDLVKMDDERFKFISLNDKPSEWAKIIIKDFPKIRDRKSNDECIKKAGYDINTEIKKIEKYFNRK